MTNAKYHHLVPRTYLRSWIKSGNSVEVLNKSNGLIELKNIDNNFGLTQYHSIVPGMQICTQSDLENMYKCIKGYEVYIEDQFISSLDLLNRLYCIVDKWEIRKDGRVVSKSTKNQIISNLKQQRILEIEELWSKKYENRWPEVLSIINEKIKAQNHKTVMCFYKGLIFKNIVAMNWRGFYKNHILNQALDTIEGLEEIKNISTPPEMKLKSYLSTSYEELEHQVVLQKYREFLNDYGVMYEGCKEYIRQLTILFYKAEGKKKLFTSDNPCFNYESTDLKCDVLPVSPDILMLIITSFDNSKYYIRTLTDIEVDKWNDIIMNNAIKYVIR